MLPLENRPYEASAVHALRSDLPAYKRVLAVAPTGAGKTVVAAMLIGAEPRWRRVLWLAHRTELIEQARQSLLGLGIACGVRCSAYEQRHPDHVDPKARIQVGSVQTVVRRAALDVDLIVIDEAHRAMADSYQRIAHLRPDAEILGLTATPIRTDGRDLGDFFRWLTIIARPSDLYAANYLAAPITYAAPPEARMLLNQHLRGIPTVRGDFQLASLGRAVNDHTLVGNVVNEALRLAPSVPKVVFATTIEHSRQIEDRFAIVGVRARHLDGKTPSEDRASALRDLASGQLEVITNVDVLAEGWDCPALGAVVIARPTKSLVRFMQMVGRVQRPGATVRKLVLDHGGNAERLRHFPGEDVAWVLARGSTKTGGRTRVSVCPQCSAVLPDGVVTCPQCARPQPKSTRRVLEERETELVELERGRIEAIRSSARERAERAASAFDAPPGWVDRVVDSIATRAPRAPRR